jgi:hypothetical protein
MRKTPKKGETGKARKPVLKDLKVSKGTGEKVKGGDGTTTTPTGGAAVGHRIHREIKI